MPVTVKQLHALFAGEVDGVDLSRPIDDATHKTLDDAINRYSVIVFHGQNLDDDQLLALGKPAGDPRAGSLRFGVRKFVPILFLTALSLFR